MIFIANNLNTMNTQKTYKPGDQVTCYQGNGADQNNELYIDTATITGKRELWTGDPLQDLYGYPIQDANGMESWVFEKQIINLNK